MRKVVKEFNVFKFDELSKEVQKKVIDKERNWKYQYGSYVSDDVTEMIAEKLVELGIPLSPEWNYSSSQGDGLAFYGKIDWKTQTLVKPTPEQADLFNKVDYSVEIVSTTNHYTHYNTMKLESTVTESEMDWNKDDETKYFHNSKLINSFEEELLEKIKETSKTLFRELMKAYDAYFTDESILDDIKSDEDAEFLENGERYVE